MTDHLQLYWIQTDYSDIDYDEGSKKTNKYLGGGKTYGRTEEEDINRR